MTRGGVIDIESLFLSESSAESDDFKRGWREAICFVNDNYRILDRSSEDEVGIIFTLDMKGFEDER